MPPSPPPRPDHGPHVPARLLAQSTGGGPIINLGRVAVDGRLPPIEHDHAGQGLRDRPVDPRRAINARECRRRGNAGMRHAVETNRGAYCTTGRRGCGRPAFGWLSSQAKTSMRIKARAWLLTRASPPLLHFGSGRLPTCVDTHRFRNRRNATSAEIAAWVLAVDKRKKQGERSDLVPCGTKSKPSRETTAEAVGVSPQTVSRARLVATDPALEPKSAPTRRRPGRPSQSLYRISK